MAQNTRTYETIVITKVDMPQESLNALIEKCKGIITKEGKGEWLMSDDWSKAKIAFPIEKEPRGQWNYFRYTSLAAGVDEIQRNLKINEHVLRQFTARAADDTADYKTLRENFPKELAERGERKADWKEDRPRRGGGFRGRGRPGGDRQDRNAPSAAPAAEAASSEGAES